MSTRASGNLQIKDVIPESARDLLGHFAIKQDLFIAMEQVHGNVVSKVKRNDGDKITPDCDGLVTRESPLYLGVNTADCVPIFIYDPVMKCVGVVHSGWKGTLGNIVENAIGLLEDLGSDPRDIRVAIGPHIGGCCYTVNDDRAESFLRLFQNQRVVYKSHDTWHLDLGKANKMQLIASGVGDAHIDAPISCTSCQIDTFFSFRKDSQESFGVMLGIIGLKN